MFFQKWAVIDRTRNNEGVTDVRRISTLPFATAALAMALPVACASAAGFTGFYAGVQLGDTFGDADAHQSTSNGGALTLNKPGFKLSDIQGGFHAGYNHQFDDIIAGAIVDYNFYKANDYDGEAFADTVVNHVVTDQNRDQNSVTTNSIISLRAKGGMMAWPGTLVYGTLGWAWMNADASVDFSKFGKDVVTDDTTLATAEKRSINSSGFTYGLGTTFSMTEKTTIGFEWRHYSFGKERANFTAAGNHYDLSVDPDLDTVEINVSYFFADMLK